MRKRLSRMSHRQQLAGYRRALWLVGATMCTLLWFEPSRCHASGLRFGSSYSDGQGGVTGLEETSSVAISPDGAHVYATGQKAPGVAWFSRDSLSGALTFGGSFIGGPSQMPEPVAVKVSPDGQHAFVANLPGSAVIPGPTPTTIHYEASITVFSRNGTTGALTAQFEVDDAALGEPKTLQVSPDSKFLYVAPEPGTSSSPSVTVFAHDASLNTLTKVQTLNALAPELAAMHRLGAVGMSPDGAYFYIGGEFDDEAHPARILTYSRNSVTGTLTFVHVFNEDAHGRRFEEFAFNADGMLLYALVQHDLVTYVRNPGGGDLSFYAIDADFTGELIAVGPNPAHLYALHSRDAYTYRTKPSTAKMVKLERTNAMWRAAASVLDPTGSSLYIANGPDDGLTLMTVDKCGDALLGGDEQCDDGDLDSGDGCSSACRLEVCSATPSSACHDATKSSFVVTDSQKVDHDYEINDRDHVMFRWSGSGVTLTDLGDPTTSSSYVLCVYDGSANPQPLAAYAIPSGGQCGNDPCWSATRPGYEYKDSTRRLTPDGAEKVQLKRRDTTSQVVFSGKGENLFLDGLPLLTAPLTVQMRNAQNGACWSATFAQPTRVKDRNSRWMLP